MTIWHNDIDDNDYIKDNDNDYIITLMTITKQRQSQWWHDDIDDNYNIKDNDKDDMVVRFLALQKMVEEKKAEAEKMNMKVTQDPAALDLVHQVLLIWGQKK